MRASWAILATFVLMFAATYAVRVTPENGVRIPVPEDRLERFALCMGLTRSEMRRIRKTRHYVVPTRSDTLGFALVGQYVWSVDSALLGIWEHEWLHLILPNADPRHTSPRWIEAQTYCGAL